jgi:glycosyltransferase involved in cell wall biosynthesis
VRDGVEGLLIEPGDVAALATCMLRMEQHAVLRRKMGEAARRRVQAEYSLDAMAEKLMELYREVIVGAQPSMRRRTSGAL